MSHTVEVDVKKLKRMRINQGLTQRELASRAGVSNTTLWKIERGGGVTPPTLKKLADVLGVTPVELLDEEI
jgi:transcriptional regulator with XRE-family HTH domain